MPNTRDYLAMCVNMQAERSFIQLLPVLGQPLIVNDQKICTNFLLIRNISCSYMQNLIFTFSIQYLRKEFEIHIRKI